MFKKYALHQPQAGLNLGTDFNRLLKTLFLCHPELCTLCHHEQSEGSLFFSGQAPRKISEHASLEALLLPLPLTNYLLK